MMPIDLTTIQHATCAADQTSDRIRKSVARLTLDAERKHRLRDRECPACYYLRRGGVAGQAFTAWTCKSCRMAQCEYPNTNVPSYCDTCSDEYSVCVRCGGDIEQAVRRSLKPPKGRGR